MKEAKALVKILMVTFQFQCELLTQLMNYLYILRIINSESNNICSQRIPANNCTNDN